MRTIDRDTLNDLAAAGTKVRCIANALKRAPANRTEIEAAIDQLEELVKDLEAAVKTMNLVLS